MNSCKHRASERGIALIVVLLLMAVLSGLATGFAMTGQTEVQMATNEVYFAGARAAAEAGLNRAIVKIVSDTTTNWIAGVDGAVDPNAGAAVNADNGSLAFKFGGANGPFFVDSANRYSYQVQILDDDDPLLYDSDISGRLADMGENGLTYSNINKFVVLRSTGRGPKGTVVQLARIIESNVSTAPPSTNPSTNPAILVNGDFEMNGTITVTGTAGSVHANGNLSKTGTSGTVSGSATATGTFSEVGNFVATGGQGGGRSTLTMPAVHASDYLGIADYKLTAAGTVQTLSGGVWSDCTTSACKSTDWTFSSGTWSSGKNPASATYYVEGDVSIGATQGSGNKAVSVIATGSIAVQSGSAKLTPENEQRIQFVADGDVQIVNGSDLDAPYNVDGEIRVRGQFEAGGNMEFQGRVLVEDVQGVGNLVANGANRIHGSVRFTYNGTLGELTAVPVVGAPTYTNNVIGWLEQ
ncbi:MAG: hypothetical protein ABI039_06180 [Vicinamibacterales bacterium]